VSKISDPERPSNICVAKVSDMSVTNLNESLYLSTCHTVYISGLILFMIRPQLIINIYVSLMYEVKNKLEKYLRVNLLGPGPRLMKKEFTGSRSHKV
jgi:hypothetical protein